MYFIRSEGWRIADFNGAERYKIKFEYNTKEPYIFFYWKIRWICIFYGKEKKLVEYIKIYCLKIDYVYYLGVYIIIN